MSYIFVSGIHTYMSLRDLHSSLHAYLLFNICVCYVFMPMRLRVAFAFVFIFRVCVHHVWMCMCMRLCLYVCVSFNFANHHNFSHITFVNLEKRAKKKNFH